MFPFKKIGKTPGKDVKQGKSTLLGLVGEREVINLCKNRINTFIKKNNKRLNQNPIILDLLEFGLKRIS